jgi:hypothetical protein
MNEKFLTDDQWFTIPYSYKIKEEKVDSNLFKKISESEM